MLNNQNKLSHNEHYLIDILFNQERKSISEIGRILNSQNQQYLVS